LPIIQLTWATLKSLENQRTFYEPKEADWCLAIDVLIQHVFGRMDNTVVFREAQLYLAHSTNKIIETAVADAIVVLELRGHIPRLPLQSRLECACLPHADRDTLHVLHFVSEKKRFSGRASGLNQLLYSLTTALFQRRSLGVTHQLVFGCCTKSNEVLAYSGSWNGAQPNFYRLDTFKPLTVPGLIQLFLFLNLAASKIQPYFTELSAIGPQAVIDALSNGGVWHAHKPVRGDEDDDDDEENDDPDEGDPGGPSRPGGPGRPSGGGRGGRRGRGGRGGANRGLGKSDRKLRSHDAARKEMKLPRANEDLMWEQTLSEWRKDAAIAIRTYGKPAPLTSTSLSSLPHIPKPRRVVGAEGEVDLEELWSS